MAFWNFQTIERRVKEEEIILPYSEKQAQGCAYELKLGDEVCITSDDTQKKMLSQGEQIKIPSGQFALLITEEEVTMPLDTLAFISIKFGIKAQGLINVSGFHVDPGFKGRIKFSVYNAGAQNIILTRGDVVFMIWFCNLTEKTEDPYKGEHQNQKNITTKDVQLLQGEIVSPGQLRKKLEDTTAKITSKQDDILWKNKTLISVGVGILITCFLNLLTNLFREPSDHMIFEIKEKVKSEIKEEGWRKVPPILSDSKGRTDKSESTTLKDSGNDSK